MTRGWTKVTEKIGDPCASKVLFKDRKRGFGDPLYLVVPPPTPTHPPPTLNFILTSHLPRTATLEIELGHPEPLPKDLLHEF